MLCIILLVVLLLCGLSHHGDDLTIEEMMLMDELDEEDRNGNL